MKKVLKISVQFAITVLFCFGSFLATANEDSPEVFLQKGASKVLDTVAQNKNLAEADIISLVEADVLPYFDIVVMTRSTLGRHWGKASNEQKRALVDEISTIIKRTYTKALLIYKDDRRSISYSLLKGGNEDSKKSLVRTLIPNKNGTKQIAIDYDLFRDRNNEWKVNDITISGISLVTNYRDSFSQEIGRNGLDGLIKSLKEKNIQPIDLPQ